MNHNVLKQNRIISVIIISHQRKKFIKIAINSVLKQSLHRKYYEIIVVKNFIDEDIDSFIEYNGGKNIYTDAQTLGDKCVLGIENSNGNILVFLEDDDIFAYEKLQKVLEVFEMQDVVYFHNNHFLINHDGRVINDSLFPDMKSTRIFKLDNTCDRNIGWILKHGGSFNLSSIAVRSNILLNHLSYLKGMNVAVDNFMFYVALASKSNLRIDAKKLTLYRIHGENSSFPADQDTNLLLSRAKDFLESDIYGYKAIYNSVSDQIIKHLVQCRIFAPMLNLHVIDIKSESLTMGDYKEALKCGIKMRNIEIIILIIVDLFSMRYKNIGRYLYIHYLRRMSKLISKKI